MHLVAVLGYSSRRETRLHPVCAARLKHAERVAAEKQAVLLSGYKRRGAAAAEAELMRAAWDGPAVPIIADRTARTTRDNARAIADAARRLGADDVTIVTSRWHALRARILVRRALPNVVVHTSSPAGRIPIALALRELACIVALPYQLFRLRRDR